MSIKRIRIYYRKSFLLGSRLPSPEKNNGFFFHVQSFISESKRFFKSTQVCMFHLLEFLKYLLFFAAAPSLTNYYLLYFFGFTV